MFLWAQAASSFTTTRRRGKLRTPASLSPSHHDATSCTHSGPHLSCMQAQLACNRKSMHTLFKQMATTHLCQTRSGTHQSSHVGMHHAKGCPQSLEALSLHPTQKGPASTTPAIGLDLLYLIKYWID